MDNNTKYHTIAKKDSAYNIILPAALEDAKYTSQYIYITHIETYSDTLEQHTTCLQKQKPLNLHTLKSGSPTRKSTINSLTTFGKPHSSWTIHGQPQEISLMTINIHQPHMYILAK